MSQTAVESLALCLLEMAEAETNPVLLLIDPDTALEENKKYPASLLQFNQSGWRAYYHCHPATRAGNHRFKGEHGHFHIFVRTQNEPEEWSHLAALAIDPMGQPLGWFTVNHWVTGETWKKADILSKCLQTIPYDKVTPENSSLVECWLLSLLVLSCDKVKDILYQRDEILKENEFKDKALDVLQDKEVYLLSEVPIRLIDLLQEGEE